MSVRQDFPDKYRVGTEAVWSTSHSVPGVRKNRAWSSWTRKGGKKMGVSLLLEVGYQQPAAGHGSPDAVFGLVVFGLGIRSIAAQPPVLGGFSVPRDGAHMHQARSFGAERKVSNLQLKCTRQSQIDASSYLAKTYCCSSALVCSSSPPCAAGTLVSAATSRIYCPSIVH